MSQLNFECKNQVLLMSCPDRLIVADSKKQVYANFTLDEEWNGLTVVAIFSNAWETIRKEVLLTEMCVEIPTSVLTDPGFRVSLNGIGDGGTVLLSTKYMTKPISVHRAGSLVCLQAPDADPELWQQALAAIGPLSDLDTEDKSSLVAAINEVLQSGSTGAITTESIASALGYIPMSPGMVQQSVDSSAKTKVSLPGDAIDPNYGMEGQLAVSDGKGGIKWDSTAYHPYYFTDRDPVPGAGMTMKSDAIYALYNQLTNNKWNNLEDNNGNAVLREYVFSTGEYNEEGNRGTKDTDIKKPVILVMSGIHGNEKAAVVSAYKFFHDLVERKNIPSFIPESAIFKVVPVVNPHGFDLTEPGNADGVNLNRNFDYNWAPATDGKSNYGDRVNKGAEPETQAVEKWLLANKDAVLLMDLHGSGNKTDNSDKLKEVTNFVGLQNNAVARQAKITGLRGVDKVIPFWKHVMQYKEDTVYAYTSYVEAGGGCVYYATGILNIPAFALELSRMQNGATEWMAPETVSAGAEAIGNVLIQFVKEAKIPRYTNVAEVGA